MKLNLKPVKDQVIVITGASSGIGLTTARAAAAQGARVVLASRSDEALKRAVDEINGAGGSAVHVVADVSDEKEMEAVGRAAIDRFGRIDTWVNNAGVSIYGRIEEVSLDDMRKLMETNFWGVVIGSRVALNHLRGTGGVIINIGSIVSERAIPLQGLYSASKHAVKGFTDALRMEVEEARLPIAVTLVKPAAINTPFTRHAKNYMDDAPDFPPPVYAPEVVARAILHCAQTPVRDLVVGGGGKMTTLFGHHARRVGDYVMEATMFKGQQNPRKPYQLRDALYSASEDGSQRGDYEGHTAESSLYTEARMHPVAASALAAGAGMAIGAMLIKGLRSPQRRWYEWD